MIITQVKESLIGMSHSGTLNKVRNIEALLERAGNTMLSKLDPVETERTAPLAQLIHDDLSNYPLASDFKKIIELIPQDNPNNLDSATRVLPEPFDLMRMLKNKQISIEGSEGTKILRVNWRSRSSILLNDMDSLTTNGTWSAVGTAANVKKQSIYKLSGSSSIEFDVLASGDGIENTTMVAVDLTDEDEIADVIFPVWISNALVVTGVNAIWGNNLTTKFWTGSQQTAQADGTAFRNGWNFIKFPWPDAIETGAVTPSTINSFRVTLATTGPLSNVRVDNIIFSNGRPFDIKYYSKFFTKNSAGVWMARTSSDDDEVVFDSDAINIYLFECLKAIGQQIEGEDSNFDITYANRELQGDPTSADPKARMGLYAIYRAEHPTAAKRPIQNYSSGPRFRR